VLRSNRSFKEIRSTGHPLDHPVTFAQGAYLKAVFARVG
jgi:23S rRNA G2069 N7-methylase RlmK/C1962 C5-methylase RlmI